MKAKRVVGVLAALLLCICMIMPVNTDASAQVRVRTVKGVTSSYTGRMSYCYVNGQKRKLKHIWSMSMHPVLSVKSSRA